MGISVVGTEPPNQNEGNIGHGLVVAKSTGA